MALHEMTGADGHPLKIIQRIAAGDYKVFGMFLLKDENMTEVDILKKNHLQDGTVGITQAIIQKWLEDGPTPHTYEHFIECLVQSELGTLAEDVTNAQVCHIN